MAASLTVTPESVEENRRWVRDRDDRVVPLINRVRSHLGELFSTSVEPVDRPTYREEVDRVYADGDRAANVAGMVAILRALDVTDDHPGFVVDEVLGRELAGTIAGGQPLRLLAEATFHVADASFHPEGAEGAGVDDLDAALAAGFQTRLPGWPWRGEPGPFDAGPG